MGLYVVELTAGGAGAVSVLEVHGAGALDAVREITTLERLEPGELRVSHLLDGEEVLDEAIVLALTPARVELHLHGSAVLVARVTELLEGEPSSRLETMSIEEEAERLLAGARGEDAARILLDQAEGALTRHFAELETLGEVQRMKALAELLENSRRLVNVLEPPRVVLAGLTNAGKSTLFNALIGSERAITSSDEGTTRDLLIGLVHLDGLIYELVDTAGERAVSDARGSGGVELAGQGAARALMERADLVLWLERAGDSTEEAPAEAVVLKTYADLCELPPAGAISALTDPQGARLAVSRLFRERFGLSEASWVKGQAILFSRRLREHVEAALEARTESA